jgi:hypothetical protein
MSQQLVDRFRADREIMKRFVWRRIYPEEVTVELAHGGDDEEPVRAHVVPLGDDPGVGIGLEITSNLPEYVTLRQVYGHFRAQDMTHAEWERNEMNEVAVQRYQDLVARGKQLFAGHAGSGWRPTGDDGAQPGMAAGGGAVEGEDTLLPPYQFQLVGDYWGVRYATGDHVEAGHFRDLEGFRHIAALLPHPEKLIEALELQGLADSPVADENLTPQLAMEGPEIVLVENEIRRLEEEADREEEAGNRTRAAEVRQERQEIAEYLRQGRRRRLGSPSPRERARKAVGNALRRAWGRIEKTMPECAEFLRRSIQWNGHTVCYSPPSPAPKWVL